MPVFYGTWGPAVWSTTRHFDASLSLDSYFLAILISDKGYSWQKFGQPPHLAGHSCPLRLSNYRSFWRKEPLASPSNFDRDRLRSNLALVTPSEGFLLSIERLSIPPYLPLGNPEDNGYTSCRVGLALFRSVTKTSSLFCRKVSSFAQWDTPLLRTSRTIGDQ